MDVKKKALVDPLRRLPTVDTKPAVKVEAPVVAETPAIEEMRFDGTESTSTQKKLAQKTDKGPSAALNQKSRIMDPRLLFAELLEKPFVPPVAPSGEKEWAPLEAKLPPPRALPVGAVTFSHDDGTLTVSGPSVEGKKPEAVTKKMGFGEGARWAIAFDATLVKQYPRFSTREPKELWVAFLDGQRATDVAIKIDGGGRSAFDAARVLRSFLPKSKPIFGAKTTMQQIEAFGALAKAVVKGPGTPMENAVALEERSLKARGSSLLMQIIEQSEQRASGKPASILDEILAQPGGGVAKRSLPDDDKAVVAHLDGKDITAGEIREMALREQPAVDFVLPGFADANGSAHDLKIHVEQKGKGFEWSFYGTDKGSGRMQIISGEYSPAGLEKLREAVEAQPRYDMIPYKTAGERFSVDLASTALAALEKDRADLEAEMKKRGGTPVTDIFPDLK